MRWMLPLLLGCGGVARIGPVDTADTAASTPSAGQGTGGTGAATGSRPGTGSDGTGAGTGTGTGGTATGGATGTGTGGTPDDADGDGSPADVDCDDGDPTIFPGAEEICDGVDQDCDGVVEPDGVCPCPIFMDTGVVWLACDRDLTWEEAEGVCTSVGFHLPWVSSEEQNDVLRDVLDDRLGRGSSWLGLNDRAREDDFVWSNGDPLGWDNWDRWEPNDWGFSGEDCAEITRNGRWNDIECGSTMPFLCRRP